MAEFNPYVAGGEVLLSLIPEITKIFGSDKELKEADELAKIKRPEYQIADAATQALNMAKYRALQTRLPAQNVIENKIGAATAGGIRYGTETASSPVDALATASSMIGNEQNAFGNLAIEGANMFERNQDRLSNEQWRYAGEQDKKQQWDILNPYLQAKQKESDLRKAGAENKQHGIEGVFGNLAMGLDLFNRSGAFEGGSKSFSSGGGDGTGGFNKKPFGGIDMGAESFTGLSPQQKMQAFKMKYGRYPNSWELGETGLNDFSSYGQRSNNTPPFTGA